MGSVGLAVALAWATGGGAQGPVIDMHLHAFSFDEYGDPPPPNEVTGAIPGFQSNREYATALRGELRANRIVRVVASGPMDRVMEWRRDTQLEVMGGAYAGSRDALPSIAELRTAIAAGDISVLGELGLQYRGVDPNAPQLRPYW